MSYGRKEYEMIASYYNQKQAKRSGVPYINHINEGIKLLSYMQNGHIREDFTTASAGFCLHPIYQDGNKIAHLGFSSTNAHLYSIIANTFLRHNYLANRDYLWWIPVNGHSRFFNHEKEASDVYLMLVADKVQNYKDFQRFRHKYEQANDIDNYFLWWFDVLQISHKTLKEYISVIS